MIKKSLIIISILLLTIITIGVVSASQVKSLSLTRLKQIKMVLLNSTHKNLTEEFIK